MKYTNEQNLPQSVVRAAQADEYSRGKADISVTSLIDAPRLHIMQQAFGGEMAPEVDVSTRLWPLLGTAFHAIMDHDHEPGVFKEERLFTDINGWVVSGAIDRQVRKGKRYDIEDFKVTSVYSYMGAEKGEKWEWANQLNCYATLVEENGRLPGSLYIIALLRDWRPMEAKTKAGYPPKPIMRFKVDRWSRSQRLAYMSGRVAMHQEAQAQWDTDGTIVECNSEERWATPDKWALMRKGRKTAVKLYEDKMDALSKTVAGAYIEHRPGENRRCEGYCDFAPMCGQFQRIKEDAITSKVWEKMDVKE